MYVADAFGVKTLMRAVFLVKAEDDGSQDYFNGLFRRGQQLRLGMGDPMADYVEWEKNNFPTAPAPFTTRDAKFTSDAEAQRDVQRMSLFDVKLKKFLPGARIYAQTGIGDVVRSDVPGLIGSEIGKMRKRMKMARELLGSQSLFGGAVSIGPTQIADMLYTLSLTYSDISTSYTPTGDWSNASGTKIVSVEWKNLKKKSYQASRLQPGLVILGDNVHGYLRQNAEIQTIYAPIRRDPIGPGLPIFSTEPGNIFNPAAERFELDGLEVNLNRAGYDNAAASFTTYVPDKGMVVLPKDLSACLGYADGYGVIPREAIGAPQTTMISPASEAGEYSYATVESDPAGINLFYGWRGFIGVPYAPGVLYRADVTSTS